MVAKKLVAMREGQWFLHMVHTTNCHRYALRTLLFRWASHIAEKRKSGRHDLSMRPLARTSISDSGLVVILFMVREDRV